MDEMFEFEEIINCHALAKKETVTYSEMILSMIELNNNPIKYGIFSNPGTKKFWKSLLENKYIGNIFADYTDDTIRKYWSLIKKCKSRKKFIIIVNVHKDLIDNCGKTLHFLISTIALSVNLDLEVKEFPAFLNMKITASKNKVLNEALQDPKKEDQEDFVIENNGDKVNTDTNAIASTNSEAKEQNDQMVKKKVENLVLCEKIFMKFKNRLFSEKNLEQLQVLMKKRRKDKNVKK